MNILSTNDVGETGHHMGKKNLDSYLIDLLPHITCKNQFKTRQIEESIDVK